MIQINRYLVAVILCAAPIVLADDDYSVYGDMAAEVLVTPRSAALAGADMAFNPAGAMASNPALTARPAPPELSLAYSSYYGDVFSASTLHYTGRIGSNGGIGAAAAYLLIPGIEDTRGIAVDTVRGVVIDPVDTDNIETFTASDVWARVSYGHRFDVAKSIDLYAGAAVTARRRRLETITAYGLGVDLGVTAHFKKPSLYTALILENVRHSAVYWQDSDGYDERVPQHLRASLAYERIDPYIYGRIALYYTTPDLLSNEGVNSYGTSNDREEERVPKAAKLSDDAGLLFSAARYGVEYTIMETLSLRAGMDLNGYTLGAGLNLFKNRAGIDFCYVNHELAGTVKMSLTYRWADLP